MKNLDLRLVLKLVKDQFDSAITGVKSKLADFSAQADSSGNKVEGFQQKIGQSVRSIFDLTGAIKALVAGFSVLALLEGAKGIVAMADNMRLVAGRVKLASDNTAEFAKNYAQLVAISFNTGTELEANAEVFARINAGMREMGGTSQDSLRQVDLLAKGFKISGAAQSESSAAIRQWSQAIASGVLRGDEFNSIMENAPRIQRALADGLGVSIGQLRKMAEAGELTASAVSNALVSQGKAIDEEFKKIPVTIGIAFEKIKTAFGQYVADADNSAGATQSFAASLEVLANNLKLVLDTALTLGKIAALIFAGNAIAGLSAYIAAQVRAAAMAKLHGEALQINAQMAKDTSLAQAQGAMAAAEAIAAQTSAQAANLSASQAAISVMREEALARLATTNAAIAQARATVASLQATVQTTPIVHLLAQATAELTAAETKRAAILTELSGFGQVNAQVTAELAAAETAAAEASNALTAAQTRLAAAQGTVNAANIAGGASFRSLLNPLNLMHLAMAGMAGFMVGEWLGSFQKVREAALITIHSIMSGLDELQIKVMKIDLFFTFNPAKIDALKEKIKQAESEFLARQDVRDKTLSEALAYENKPPVQNNGGGANAPSPSPLLGGAGVSQSGTGNEKAVKAQLDADLAAIKTEQSAAENAHEIALAQVESEFKAKELALKQLDLSEAETQRRSIALAAELADRKLAIDAAYLKQSHELELKAIDAKIAAQQAALQSSAPASTSLAGLVAGGESGAKGYNAFNRGTDGNQILPATKSEDLAALTIGEIQARQALSVVNQDRLGAVGKYQLIASTLKDAVSALKLTADTKFDATTQERIFSEYLVDAKRPSVKQFVSGESNDVNAVIRNLSQEFASIANPATGKSFYDGKGGNSATISVEQVKQALLAARGAFQKTTAEGVGKDAAFQIAIKGGAEGSDPQADLEKLKALESERLASIGDYNAKKKLLGIEEANNAIALSGEQLAAAKADGQRQVAIQEEKLQAARDAALNALELRQLQADQELSLGQITEAEHLKREQAFADERLKIEQNLLDEKRKLLGQDALALLENLNRKAAMEQQAAIDAQKRAYDKANAIKTEQEAVFQGMIGPFENAISGMTNGILSGQQTIANAVRNALANILTSYAATFVKQRAMQAAEWAWQKAGLALNEAQKKAIKDGDLIWTVLLLAKEKAVKAAHWAWDLLGFGAKETAKTDIQVTNDGIQAGSKVISETTKVGAVVGSEAAQTAATASGESARSGISLLAFLKARAAQAAKAAMGAFASVMELGIPPPFNFILAGAAGAAAFAGVMALGSIASSKDGLLEVPEDRLQFVHKKETILPAPVADNFRKITSGAIGGTVPRPITETLESIKSAIGGQPPVKAPTGLKVFNDLVASGAIPKSLSLPRFAVDIGQESQQQANTLARERLAQATAPAQGGDTTHSKTEIHMNGIMVTPEQFIKNQEDTIAKVAHEIVRKNKVRN